MTFRAIPGYEGKYEVSNTGLVKSLFTGKLKPFVDNGRGYIYVILGKQKHFYVHRAVAIAFIPNPKNFPQVNHKNSIKSDNRVENLEWCNNSMNQKHCHASGSRKYPDHKGENNPNYKHGEYIRTIISYRKKELEL